MGYFFIWQQQTTSITPKKLPKPWQKTRLSTTSCCWKMNTIHPLPYHHSTTNTPYHHQMAKDHVIPPTHAPTSTSMKSLWCKYPSPSLCQQIWHYFDHYPGVCPTFLTKNRSTQIHCVSMVRGIFAIFLYCNSCVLLLFVTMRAILYGFCIGTISNFV